MTADEKPSGVGGERWTLRQFATAFTAALGGSSGADRRAYTSLGSGSQREPWTDEAVGLWEAGGGARRSHHLAIAHHARAYDLEDRGDDEAFVHWRVALRHWADVHRDDAFWARLRDVAARDGADARGGPDQLDAAVRAARTGLPDDLLAVHVTRAAGLAAADPDRARRHVEVILGSSLPPDAVERARARLGEAVADRLGPSVPGAFAERSAELRRWLDIDPTNVRLMSALLVTSRRWCEADLRKRNAVDLIGPRLADMWGWIRPLVDGPELLDPTRRQLDREIAQLRWWTGLILSLAARYTDPWIGRLGVRVSGTLSETRLGMHVLALTHLRAAAEAEPDLEDVQRLIGETSVVVMTEMQDLDRSDDQIRVHLEEAVRHAEQLSIEHKLSLVRVVLRLRPPSAVERGEAATTLALAERDPEAYRVSGDIALLRRRLGLPRPPNPPTGPRHRPWNPWGRS